MRDPTQSGALWRLWDGLERAQRQQPIEVINACRRTGTGLAARRKRPAEQSSQAGQVNLG